MKIFHMFFLGLAGLISTSESAAAQFERRIIPDITDCVRPLQEAAVFCRDPTLRAAEAEVARLWAITRTAGPMVWSIRENQESWKFVHRSPNSKIPDLHHAYALRAMELTQIERNIRQTLEMTISRDELAARCVTPPHLDFESFVRPCKVGEVVGVAPGLIAQKGEWETPRDPGARFQFAPTSITMVVLTYVGTAADRGASGSDTSWRPIAWADEIEGSMGTPVLSDGPSGTFLRLPRNGGGSAEAAKDLVMQKVGPNEWREIDVETWTNELARRLPRPLSYQSRFNLDLANLSTVVTLTRPEDTNCCPTGGTAEVQLAIRGDVVVLDGLILKPFPRSATPTSAAPRQTTSPRR